MNKYVKNFIELFKYYPDETKKVFFNDSTLTIRITLSSAPLENGLSFKFSDVQEFAEFCINQFQKRTNNFTHTGSEFCGGSMSILSRFYFTDYEVHTFSEVYDNFRERVFSVTGIFKETEEIYEELKKELDYAYTLD